MPGGAGHFVSEASERIVGRDLGGSQYPRGLQMGSEVYGAQFTSRSAILRVAS